MVLNNKTRREFWDEYEKLEFQMKELKNLFQNEMDIRHDDVVSQLDNTEELILGLKELNSKLLTKICE